jgi:hypothetical protein
VISLNFYSDLKFDKLKLGQLINRVADPDPQRSALFWEAGSGSRPALE